MGEANRPPNPLASPEPWNAVASGYARSTKEFLGEYSRTGLARLELGSNMVALDVACGPGTTTLMLAKRVARVHALDFSSAMLSELERGIQSAELSNVEARQGDGQALPYADESFDVAVSMFGLMFFPDRAAGFGELFRTLRPGGSALVSSWAPTTDSPAMQILFGALRAADPSRPEPKFDVSSLENPDVFEAEMRAAGFVDVSVEPVVHGIDVAAPAEFWHGIVEGCAPLALMQRKLGATEWKRKENMALAHLEQTLTDLPTTLTSTAHLAFGTKPG